MTGQAIQHALLAAPDRVRRLVAITPVPAVATPFDPDGWALFSGAAENHGNRAAIINFTTGSRLTPAFVDHIVRHSAGESDTAAVFNPATYVTGVPFAALARLRRASPVVWVDELPVDGWPGGPGFWLVLRHADVEAVLKQPHLFSSWLGATQIRDPASPEAL